MKVIQTITDRDQALFEAGIKFGSLYHQFVGMPLSPAGIEAAENAIEKSISAQPFVEEIKVKIDEKRAREELNDKFQYTELKGFMLDVKAVIRYQTARVHVSLKFDEKLDYPLMKIDSIEEDGF